MIVVELKAIYTASRYNYTMQLSFSKFFFLIFFCQPSVHIFVFDYIYLFA